MKLKFAALPLSIFLCCGIAHADGAFNQTDKRFVTEAANAGVYEVQAAQVAAKKAQNPQVREYAEMLVRDHEKSNEELRKLAATQSMELPRELPHELRGRVQGLERAKPAGFDKQFLGKVGLDDHEKAIKLYQRASDESTNPELKAFAKDSLPELRKHREQAQKLIAPAAR